MKYPTGSTGLAALMLFVAGPAQAQAQAAPDAQALAADRLFARYAGDQTPGCAVAVAKAGRTVLDRAYGMADLDHGIRAVPATIYEAGSVSKQFTAAAILLLARDGKLSLEDDVRKYLPEMPDYGAPVTLGQMIRHSSGLRDWGAVAAMSGWPRNSRVANNDDVLALAAQQKGLNFAPGTHYSYSNTNFNLAALIIARVSGQSLASFTEQRIFKPLGMKNSRWRERYQAIVPGRARRPRPTGAPDATEAHRRLACDARTAPPAWPEPHPAARAGQARSHPPAGWIRAARPNPA